MAQDETIRVSSLGKTWILDLDGTIVKHNGYRLDGMDTFLDGAEDFLEGLPKEDMIIFVTSRTLEWKEKTERFLEENKVAYHQIIYNAPFGERILLNDEKPSGLKTAVAVNTKRDEFCSIHFVTDEKI